MMNDLRRHNQSLLPELRSKALAVMESGWFVLGSHVKEFERESAAYCQTESCVTVANGSDALELALRAVGIGMGDKVITVANAGAYGTMAILAVGATPVYVEIDPDDMLISVEHLRKTITPAIRAVVVTHLYGRVAQVNDVKAIADEYGIPIIEDCAQAHGAMLDGRRVGSIGAIGCFSFYPTKNLGAMGDGGAVVVNDLAIASRVQMLRQYGWSRRYAIDLAGGVNSRMDELQAAILQVKLPRLDNWNQKRVQICRQYATNIRHPLIRVPSVYCDGFVGHLFVVRTSQRDALRLHLQECQIVAEVHYPIPDHRQPAFAHLFPDTSLLSTEIACEEVLSLPCFPEMSASEVHQVIDAANGWVPK